MTSIVLSIFKRCENRREEDSNEVSQRRFVPDVLQRVFKEGKGRKGKGKGNFKGGEGEFHFKEHSCWINPCWIKEDSKEGSFLMYSK
ncbi:hypothetical protein L1987_48392 [Smallanthus sonchifolius]|uniref:Uncharacterized protein n=1 Tax=Smallanthus sonchifolius TaxID=185202 RepID=A0ACB9FRT3_9ASTR|nr:hypothetical protein L1987_48392 [Smallanthus sonchifolius]